MCKMRLMEMLFAVMGNGMWKRGSDSFAKLEASFVTISSMYLYQYTARS